jgi:hypothetical protein
VVEGWEKAGSAKRTRRTEAVDCVGQFPGEVVGVHHGDVHALPRFGTVRVAGWERMLVLTHFEMGKNTHRCPLRRRVLGRCCLSC